ncbi:phenazine biosynthesis protein PhzF like [Vibrio ponticus]|nr:phenazine biosynthesis protein PhzF like [Vibrio ponticus]
MKSVDVFLVNSFTAQGEGGNPAGVVLNADALSDKEKLVIAKAVGYSETAFVSQDNQVDFEVSFFTVTEEVDFCGHATLAAFSTLYQQGLLTQGYYVQRTKAGLLGVNIEADGHVVMEQKLPEYLGGFSYQDVSELIGIDSAILSSTQLPIEVISTGLADIIVPLPIGYLDQIQLHQQRTIEFCQKHSVVGIHAFEMCEEGSTTTASCRNFAPLLGILEESATGSASGALACYLFKHLSKNTDNQFIFEQGRAMNCRSEITATVESDSLVINKVSVGGFASRIGRIEIKL